jgi:hypothetical protein
MNKFLIILLLTSFIACTTQKNNEHTAVGEAGWLKGSNEEKLEEIAHQLGGFSRTMLEVSYRYSELYWAGEDENWKYAEHQLEHMIEALEDGLTRRPVRAESAEDFMKNTLPAMEEAISSEDPDVFRKGFFALTSGCNGCHAKEGEAYIQIQLPQVRQSPVRW